MLFTIAGYGLGHSLACRSVATLVKERSRRLLVPFLFGLLLVAPPQVFFELSGNPAYGESFRDFYPKFFGISLQANFPWFFGSSPDSQLFEPTNLWFLYDLLIFMLLLLPLLLWLRRGRGFQIQQTVCAYWTRLLPLLLLGLPLGIIGAGLGVSRSGGWNHLGYLVFLFYGYLLAADPRFIQALWEHRKKVLALALVFTIIGFVWFGVFIQSRPVDPMQSMDWMSVSLRLFKGFWGWFWVAAILGFMEQWRRGRANSAAKPPPSRRRAALDSLEGYARRAALPFYILHQVIIVAIGFFVVQWQVAGIVKFLVISLSALVAVLLIYQVVIKQTSLTRFLFGIKPPPPPQGERFTV